VFVLLRCTSALGHEKHVQKLSKFLNLIYDRYNSHLTCHNIPYPNMIHDNINKKKSNQAMNSKLKYRLENILLALFTYSFVFFVLELHVKFGNQHLWRCICMLV
jgi:hypothetical protein